MVTTKRGKSRFGFVALGACSVLGRGIDSFLVKPNGESSLGPGSLLFRMLANVLDRTYMQVKQLTAVYTYVRPATELILESLSRQLKFLPDARALSCCDDSLDEAVCSADLGEPTQEKASFEGSGIVQRPKDVFL